jgi:trehalose synthase
VLAARDKERVRERFLLTRLIADELRLYTAVLGKQPATGEPAAKVGLAGEVRDPICGMRLDGREASTVEFRGQRFVFCSQTCRSTFEATPERFAAQPVSNPE